MSQIENSQKKAIKPQEKSGLHDVNVTPRSRRAAARRRRERRRRRMRLLAVVVVSLVLCIWLYRTFWEMPHKGL